VLFRSERDARGTGGGARAFPASLSAAWGEAVTPPGVGAQPSYGVHSIHDAWASQPLARMTFGDAILNTLVSRRTTGQIDIALAGVISAYSPVHPTPYKSHTGQTFTDPQSIALARARDILQILMQADAAYRPKFRMCQAKMDRGYDALTRALGSPI